MIIKQNRYNFLLIVFTLVLSSQALITSKVYPQDFNEGLKYYKQKDFKKAASIFEQIKRAEAYLFAGKSYYALGKYDEAQSNLNNITSDAFPQIQEESLYTSALINFQQKQFGNALSKLFTVSNIKTDDDLSKQANDLYQQILGYLSAAQQIDALSNVSKDEIRFNILKTGIAADNYSDAKTLFKAFNDQTKEDEWKDKAKKFDKALKNTSSFMQQFNGAAKELSPPDGTIYTIGVALPQYKPNNQEFNIVKAMYFGALYAAKQFNKQTHSVRAYIQFIDTGTSDDNIRPAMEKFKNKNHGDVVIGPLFSSQAKPMVTTATDLKIPTLAPLANSDIQANNSYLFQVNPTFKVHGIIMADYAVNSLGLNNFAILADKNSNGSVSAKAFREEAEKEGANIEQYFVENMQNNYDISKYAKYLKSTDSEPIDAIYAPFTGGRALTMIDLLVKNLHSFDHPVPLLGSQEYRNLNFQSGKYHGLHMYFSESMHLQDHSRKLTNFKNGYQQQFGSAGNRFSMIGYDVAHLILETLDKVGNPDLLSSALRHNRMYHGLINNIYFGGTNVNKAVKIIKVSSSGNLSAQN